jgi:single-strand DNA-binding protein
MYGLNDITLAGALTREPELAYTPNGTAILRLTVAGEERIVASNGEVKRMPFYQNLKLLGPMAEDYVDLKAGTGLIVSGVFSYSSWDDPQGERRSRLEVLGTRLLETTGAECVIDSAGGVRSLEGVNSARICGNLTRDPELRHTGNGVPVMNLSLAVNETVRRVGRTLELTHYVEVTLWGAMAENHAALRRGVGVFAMGRLVSESWSDRDGNKRLSLKLEASHLEVLRRRAQVEAPIGEPQDGVPPLEAEVEAPVSSVPVTRLPVLAKGTSRRSRQPQPAA